MAFVSREQRWQAKAGWPVHCSSFTNYSVSAVFLGVERVCRKKADVFNLLLLSVLSDLDLS